MKKIYFLPVLFAIFTGLIALDSCQTTGKASSVSKLLKFNFENGKGYDYELIINLDQQIGNTQRQTDITTYYSMIVTGDNGNEKTIKTRYERLKMSFDVSGMKVEVDTDKPLTGDFGNNDVTNVFQSINRIFGAVKGQSFSMKVNSEGKISEVTGFEQMANSIADSMHLDSTKRKQMLQVFLQQFNEKSVKGQFERFLFIFPNKEVRVGDTWKKTTETSGVMAARYNSEYKVTDIEGDMVTIKEETIIDTDKPDMKLKGEVKGTLIVDSRSGLVVKADQDISGSSEEKGREVKIRGKNKLKGKEIQ